jgi:UDP-N-acetylglucosamine 2-epimerase (non-hydrolysing)
MLTILNVVGARPNFMKMAPLVHAMRAHGQIHQILVHTGQHYGDNLSGVFFRELQIPEPDFHLGVGSFPRQEQISRIESAFEPVLVKTHPDVVMVVGDVNSTIACARVAHRLGIRVAHVEAGLRSFDQDMPEEHNRIQTDNLSDFLFVTEESGIVNLDQEQVAGKRFLVGNVMIDSLKRMLESSAKTAFGATSAVKPYLVMTIHRPSNVDDVESLTRVLDVLEAVSARLRVFFPLHPRTRAAIEKFGLVSRLESMANVTITVPLGYSEFVGLVAKSAGVVTDSGGIQEETTFLGVPCITMRHNTERPSTVTLGTNVLVGSDPAMVIAEVEKILNGTFKRGSIPPQWDGSAAVRIVDHLFSECSVQPLAR